MAPKADRPQNAHLRPLNELDKTNPELAHEIRVRGGKNSAKKRREQADFAKVAKYFLTLGIRGGKRVKTLDEVTNLTDAQTENISVIADIFLTEYERYKETGDKESRDWLLSMTKAAGINVDPASLTVEVPSDPAGDGVRIHLIRGEKPKEEQEMSDKTTRGGDDAAAEPDKSSEE